MTRQLSISRRELIVGGLVVAFAVSARARAATSEATGPNAIGGFVRISQEGVISLVMPSVEMGQGIYTAEAALLAEELDVRLDQIVAIAAPPDASLYAQPLFKAQMTGGSTSIRGFCDSSSAGGGRCAIHARCRGGAGLGRASGRMFHEKRHGPAFVDRAV